MYQSQNHSSFYLCPRIKGSDEFHAYYGGDQSWLKRNTAFRSGCAPTCGANVMTILAMNSAEHADKLGVSLDKRNFISQEDYTRILNGIYRYMGIFEIPGANKYYDQLPREQKPSFPVTMGTNLLLFANGVRRYGKKCRIKLAPTIMFTRGSSYYRGLAFIKLALTSGYPVVLLTTGSAFDYTIFERPYMQAPCTVSMKYHFVTITDVRDTAVKDEPNILITSLGKTGEIPYKDLYNSWQSPRSLGSGLCYFVPVDK